MKLFEDTYQLITYELRASLYRYTFMNTDEQVLDSGNDLTNMFACLLIKSCTKMTAYQLKNLLCLASSLAICAYRAHF